MYLPQSNSFVIFNLPETNCSHLGVIKYSWFDVGLKKVKFIVALGNDFEYKHFPTVFQIDNAMVEYLLFEDHSHSYYMIVPQDYIVEYLEKV